MLKQAVKPKRVRRAAIRLPTHALTFEEWTRCEEALAELKRGVATLDVVWDAAENGACFDGKEAAKALIFINKGLMREIDALERQLGFKEGEGQAHA